jgi:ParB/RepB/Spo0J family partition protein
MFPSIAENERPVLEHVPLGDIRMERTPRRVTLPPSLVQSIEANGIMVPVALDVTYNVIDGVRRIRIARDLGLETVPAMVFPHGNHRATNAMITLTANMVRSQNIINELRAIEAIMRDTRVSADGLAERLGLSRRMIANRLKLRNLRVALRVMVESGRLALAPALVLATRSTGEQNGIAARLAQEPAFRPTAGWLRNHFGIIAEVDTQIPLLPDEIEQGVGFEIAVRICNRLIQAIPEPNTTDDPSHVEDLIFRLNHVAELIHAMTEPV